MSGKRLGWWLREPTNAMMTSIIALMGVAFVDTLSEVFYSPF